MAHCKPTQRHNPSLALALALTLTLARTASLVWTLTATAAARRIASLLCEPGYPLREPGGDWERC